MYTDDGFFAASPAVRHAVDVAAAALRAEGVTVETWRPSRVEDAIRLFYGLLSGDGGHAVKLTLGSNPTTRQIKGLLQLVDMPNAVRPAVVAGLEAAGQKRLAFLMRHVRPYSADQYWRLVEERNVYQREFHASLDAGGFDAVLSPPHALPALTHGASYYLGPAASYSMLYNLLGLPAGVVGVTRVGAAEESDRRISNDVVDRTARQVEQGSAGLPVGAHIAARPWREDVVLALMSAIERRLEGTDTYPAGALASTSPVPA
jgi:fatty acid amide hydrolase